jgi:hypothetical protein
LTVSLRKTRVAVVDTHPIQYFAPLSLWDFSLRGAVDRGFGQKVARDVDLPAGYSHDFVCRRWRFHCLAGLQETLVRLPWRGRGSRDEGALREERR